MLALTPFARDAAIAVLDVGGGYGIVADEVLRAFPRATVTLQDYSTPMIAAAKERLAAHGDRLRTVLADLTDASWPKSVGGPVDLATSGIAIHNLRTQDAIAAAYKGVAQTLKPGGLFLDYDYVGFTGGADWHLDALRKGGFATAEVAFMADRAAVMKAVR
jgi:ubiquinone/menaquinone biosynthesis C-methylase UbiE